MLDQNLVLDVDPTTAKKTSTNYNINIYGHVYIYMNSISMVINGHPYIYNYLFVSESISPEVDLSEANSGTAGGETRFLSAHGVSNSPI